MAARKGLRVVEPDEAPPAPKSPMTVTKAAAEGTPRDLLVAMRDRVATDVENPITPSRDLAALTRRLMEIVALIEAMDAAAAGEDDGEATPDEEWSAEAL